jgi:hypothetical protein
VSIDGGACFGDGLDFDAAWEWGCIVGVVVEPFEAGGGDDADDGLVAEVGLVAKGLEGTGDGGGGGWFDEEAVAGEEATGGEDVVVGDGDAEAVGFADRAESEPAAGGVADREKKGTWSRLWLRAATIGAAPAGWAGQMRTSRLGRPMRRRSATARHIATRPSPPAAGKKVRLGMRPPRLW